ncbi:MAG: NADH-quinone oxidoreductase subunit NuoH [Phycisphaerales bacterium]|nr:NADH-quinone oxidoreductase subunit NuoH [Phycisphaerales bacterium]MCB9840772.1 NADH-quinone oxidoreductase subunit NuoH [Phycisphaeraceae bacterium]
MPTLAALDITQTFVSVHVFVIVVHVFLIAAAYLIYLERKISAYIQDRIGPNRVGFDFGLPILAPLKGMWGLGQSLADGMKFLLKEDYAPDKVDKALFTLAPMAIVIPALIGFAVIPWGGTWAMPEVDLPLIGTIGGQDVLVAGADINVGIVYLLAVASLGVYGVVLGGWASNNKYSFLGGLRATAQMLSYEIPLGTSLLCVLLLVGSLIPTDIIRHQADAGWLFLAQPLAAVVFFIAILAESNRAPFDNAEAEQELVGGYHTEYSSMRFALFFLAEYCHMLTSCSFFVLLFLGGYHLPGVPGLQPEDTAWWCFLLKFLVFFGKVLILVNIQIVLRWTLPRLRYDQVMMMAWQAVIPLSIGLLVMTAVMVFLGLDAWAPMLLANIVAFGVIMAIQPMLPKNNPNRKIPMYGSRFNPTSDEAVITAPTHAAAREDRPVQGTLPA